MRNIPFSPPDITDAEINEVVDTLRSGWITTGPKTKKFEAQLAEYCGAPKIICLNSATAGMELVLRLFGVGEGDEVITTPYTFAATANVILHTGATPVMVDVRDDFNIDPARIAAALTTRTKAVVPVDIGGLPAGYDEINEVVNSFKDWSPKKGTLQEELTRPLVMADSAHAFGASYKGKKLGTAADVTVFSFHAVKNLTTAEGGAVTLRDFGDAAADELYRRLQLMSLHGQSKDALSKMQAGAWKYTIEEAGYKHNMTDIQAAMGLAQLSRYDSEIVPARRGIIETYLECLAGDGRFILPVFETPVKQSSYHIFMLRLAKDDEGLRDEVIRRLAGDGVACNVHFIPLPMHPLYSKLGYRMEDYPVAAKLYRSEITLPVHSKMTTDDACYVCERLKEIADELKL